MNSSTNINARSSNLNITELACFKRISAISSLPLAFSIKNRPPIPIVKKINAIWWTMFGDGSRKKSTKEKNIYSLLIDFLYFTYLLQVTVDSVG